MQILIQRVAHARVLVDGRETGAIGHGLLALLCAERGDTEALCPRLLQRLLGLRVFADDAGRMNRSVQDVGGGVLIVSQFTLAADTTSGRRPSFSAAAPPEEGKRLYEHFVALARAAHPCVATGEFGADMQIELVADGPVTMTLRTPTE